MEKQVCIKCGNQVENGGLFCPFCGSKLEMQEEVTEKTFRTELMAEEETDKTCLMAEDETDKTSLMAEDETDKTSLMTEETDAAVVYEAPQKKVALREKEISKDNKKSRGIGLKVGSFFLILLACIFLTASFCIYMIRLCTNHEAVETVMDKVDITQMQVGNTFINSNIMGIDEDSTLTEVIYYSISKQYRNMLELTTEDVEEILEASTLRIAFANKMNDYLDAFYKDGNAEITVKELRKILEKNEKLITKKIGYSVTDKNYEEFEAYFDQDYLDTLAYQKIARKIGHIELYRFLLSYTFMYILLGVTVICFILMIILNRHFIMNAVHGIGISITVSGVAAMMATIVLMFMPTVVYELVRLDRTILKPWITYAADTILPCSAILLAAGVAILILHAIVNKIISFLRK